MKLTPSQIIAGLVARGVPEHIAKGVAMNFRDESSYDTGARESGGGGFGLAQWTGPRRTALETYARTMGKPVDDPDLQLDFFMQENAGSEKAAWQKVMAAQTAQDAAKVFVNEWERPAAEHAASRSARYAGDSPSESGGARFGGTGLAPPAVVVPAPMEAPSTGPVDTRNPWSGLASGLAGSVKKDGGMLAGGGQEQAPLPTPEFASALPQAQPLQPVGLDLSPLADLFGTVDIGQAGAMNVDPYGNPIRRRQYG